MYLRFYGLAVTPYPRLPAISPLSLCFFWGTLHGALLQRTKRGVGESPTGRSSTQVFPPSLPWPTPSFSLELPRCWSMAAGSVRPTWSAYTLTPRPRPSWISPNSLSRILCQSKVTSTFSRGTSRSSRVSSRLHLSPWRPRTSTVWKRSLH